MVNIPGSYVLTVALSAASALAYAGATVAVHHATAGSPQDDPRGGVAGQAVRSPLWWGGIGLNALGYGLQALALVFGPLVVVQPVLVLTLVFALPIGARVAGHRLSRRAWLLSSALVVALAVFVVSATSGGGTLRQDRTLGWTPVAVVVTVLVVGCLVAARGRRGVSRALLLAVAAGVLAGLHAALTKVVVDEIPRGWAHVLLGPAFLTVVVIGLLSLWFRQLAFQAEWLHASVPTLTVLEPAMAAALGVLVLGERLREGSVALGLVAVSLAVLVLTTAMLARTVALEPMLLEPDPPRDDPSDAGTSERDDGDGAARSEHAPASHLSNPPTPVADARRRRSRE